MSVATATYKDFLAGQWGEDTLIQGYISIPKLIFDYRRRLGITAKALELIIKVFQMQKQGKKCITDKDINVDSQYYVQYTRQRKALKAKGLLKCKVVKILDEREGEEGYKSLGTTYDFSGLIEAIKKLVSELGLKSKKENNNKDTTSQENNDVAKREPVSEDQSKKYIQKEIDKNNYDDETKKFLIDFADLYNEVLGYNLNYSERKDYKKHLLEKCKIRNRTIAEAKQDIIEAYNLEVSGHKKPHLLLQDKTAILLLKPVNNKPSNIVTHKVKTIDEFLNKDIVNTLLNSTQEPHQKKKNLVVYF